MRSSIVTFLCIALATAIQGVAAAGGCPAAACPTIGARVGRNAEPADGAKEAVICAKCGQFRGSKPCCKEDAKACAKCKLQKGSPGCCKLPAGAEGNVPVCGKCGQIEGTGACCKKGAPDCAKCKLQKGSPGCCKLGKPTEI